MNRPLLGLLHRRECLLPTRRGWLALLIAAALALVALGAGAYPFLAVQDSVPGGVLIAEGWLPDYGLKEALAEFRSGSYSGLYVSGIPLDQGAILSEYRTFAELSAAVLLKLGADPQTLHAVPAPPVAQDRTFSTALALRDYLQSHGVRAEKVNIVSLGAHSRRTRLLYEKAFGPGVRVGIIAVPHRDFDPARWWRSSQGVRVVIDEIIAYLYGRCLFHPKVTPPA